MFENEWFPKANAIGVSWNEFWKLNPHVIMLMVKGHNERERAELNKCNAYAHLQGQYFADAILATVGNMFKKKTSMAHEYPKKPYDFANDEENNGNPESKEEIAVFEMKQRIKILEKQGLKPSPK